jgi:hypothetical protein
VFCGCKWNIGNIEINNIPIDDMCRLWHNHLTTCVVYERTANSLRAQHAKTNWKLDLRST